MKNIIKLSITMIQAIIIGSLFFYSFYIIEEKEIESDKLNNRIVELNNKIDSDFEYYSETIKEIVKTVQVTDSYLFVGGLSQEETAEWNTEKYEQILTMKSNLDELIDDTENFFSTREEYLNDLPNIWPLMYSEDISIKSAFGERYSPITGKFHFHNGIDLFSRVGDKIIATADGIVKDNWIYHSLYGRWVVIDHGGGLETGYSHLARVYVKEGQEVKKGDVIGIIGNSGASTGVHVHYTISQNGNYVDPTLYIR